MFGCCTECIKLIVGLCGVCWISVVRIFVGHLPAEQHIPSAQSAHLHCEVPFHRAAHLVPVFAEGEIGGGIDEYYRYYVNPYVIILLLIWLIHNQVSGS